MPVEVPAMTTVANTPSVAAAAPAATERAPAEPGVLLSFLPAPRGPRRFALLIVVLSLVVCAALAPFAGRPLARVDAFIPAYEAALMVCDLLTAALLFGRLKYMPSQALLVLASGYLFTAAMVAVHALSFPGAFSPMGLLGAGAQTTAWVYMFWHSGFPIAVLGYALLKESGTAAGVSGRLSTQSIWAAPVIAVASAVGLALLATAGQDLLPAVMHDNGYTGAMIGVVSTVWALCVLALAALWGRRRHSILDIWLMVILCVWLCDVALSAVLNAGRFDLGFYAGRIYGLAAGGALLIVLLLDSDSLYAQSAGQRVFDTSVDLILVVDRRGNFLQVSPSSAAILGLHPDEMVGRNAVDFIWQDDLEHTRGEMRQARRGCEMRCFDARYVHRDGRLIALSWTGVWSEREQRYFFIGRDVTARKEAEDEVRRLNRELEDRVRQRTAELAAARDKLEELHTAEVRYRVLLDSVADYAIFTLDAEGYVENWNGGAERLQGYRAEEIIGRHFSVFYTEDDQLRQHPFHELEVAATRGRYEEEGWRVRKDGSQFWASVTITGVRGADGALFGFAKVARDMTQRRKADEAIRHLNQELEQRVADLRAANSELESFSYSVSHDLRAPLRAIDGFARILLEDHVDAMPAEARRLLEIVRRNSQRMGHLIDDLLAFSRLGRQKLKAEPVHLKALVRQIMEELEAECRGRTVELTVGELGVTPGDPALLKQALTNLLSNAVKFTRNREVATIEVGRRTEPQNGAVYYVRDNGAGFDMQYADKLFAVFQRLHRREDYDGTGVGLAIVQRVINRHGGRVWAEAAVDKGATFYFTLPEVADERVA